VPKFPEPPTAAVLSAIDPEIWAFSPGARLSRIYFTGGAYPTTWNTFRTYGPTGSRFDHHIPPASVQARGILYGALDWPTCFAEVFQETRFIDRDRDAPALVIFATIRALSLLDLRKAWPTRAGASAAINSGPRARAQRWSRVIYDAYPSIDGVVYASSMNPGKSAVALYERAAGAMPAAPLFHRMLNDPSLWPRCQTAAKLLNYGIV
jgi:hypothetical protein